MKVGFIFTHCIIPDTFEIHYQRRRTILCCFQVRDVGNPWTLHSMHLLKSGKYHLPVTDESIQTLPVGVTKGIVEPAIVIPTLGRIYIYTLTHTHAQSTVGYRGKQHLVHVMED